MRPGLAPERGGMGKASRRKHDRRPPAAPKISACLIELIRPYVHDGMPIDQYQAFATMAALAWNLAAYPEFSASEEFRRALDKAPVPDDAEFWNFVEELKIRKAALFADDRRFVQQTHVCLRADGRFELIAASTPSRELGLS